MFSTHDSGGWGIGTGTGDAGMRGQGKVARTGVTGIGGARGKAGPGSRLAGRGDGLQAPRAKPASLVSACSLVTYPDLF